MVYIRVWFWHHPVLHTLYCWPIRHTHPSGVFEHQYDMTPKPFPMAQLLPWWWMSLRPLQCWTFGCILTISALIQMKPNCTAVVDWLVDWLSGWLIGSLTDWLIGWLVLWLIDWLSNWLPHWLVVTLIDWLVVWLVFKFVNWLSFWLIIGYSRKMSQMP